MTENIEEVQVEQVLSQDENQSNEQINSESNQEQQPSAQEELITKEQFNRIVAKEKEKAKRQALREFEAQRQQEMSTLLQGQNDKAIDVGNLTEKSLEDIVNKVAHKRAVEMQASQIEQQYLSKLESERRSNPDIDEQLEVLELERSPHLIMLANEYENTVDILKEIANEPTHASSILMLIQSGNVKLARAQLRKLSDSIKANKSVTYKSAPKPASQLKPEAVATGSGQRTIADFKKMFK